MRTIFVSGPFRAGDPQSVNHVQMLEGATEAVQALLGAGVAVSAPHLGALQLQATPELDEWLVSDLEVLSRCDAMLMLGSAGPIAAAEEAHAGVLSKPVFLNLPAALDWARS